MIKPGRNIEDGSEERKMPRGSKNQNNKATIELSVTQLPDTYKMCNFQINGHQHSGHTSTPPLIFTLMISWLFTCRKQLFHLLSFGASSIAQWWGMAAQTAVLCALSKAEHNRFAACVTIQGSTIWLAGSCALLLGPQTTHPAAPWPSSDPSGNMALMVACLT